MLAASRIERERQQRHAERFGEHEPALPRLQLGRFVVSHGSLERGLIDDALECRPIAIATVIVVGLGRLPL